MKAAGERHRIAPIGALEAEAVAGRLRHMRPGRRSRGNRGRRLVLLLRLRVQLVLQRLELLLELLLQLLNLLLQLMGGLRVSGAGRERDGGAAEKTVLH